MPCPKVAKKEPAHCFGCIGMPCSVSSVCFTTERDTAAPC